MFLIVETGRYIAVDGEGFDAPLPYYFFISFKLIWVNLFYARREVRVVG